MWIAEMHTNATMIIASPLLVACLLFLLSVLSLLLSSRRNDKHNLPPGPVNLPIIGSLHRFGVLPHQSLYKLSQKYGPLMYLKLGSVPTIIASSADTAKEFLKTHDLECCSRPLLTPLDKLSYGFRDIVFVPYGEQWRELRKLCIFHLFSQKKVASFRSIREEEVGRMIHSISSQRSEINLSEELMSLANDITCRTALGKRYYDEESGGGRVKGILEETQALFNAFFFADYVPMLGWLDAFTGTRARLEKNFRELDGFYQQVINEHLDPLMRRDDRDEDTIDAMLAMQRKATYITDEHIKGVLMATLGNSMPNTNDMLDNNILLSPTYPTFDKGKEGKEEKMGKKKSLPHSPHKDDNHREQGTSYKGKDVDIKPQPLFEVPLATLEDALFVQAYLESMNFDDSITKEGLVLAILEDNPLNAEITIDAILKINCNNIYRNCTDFSAAEVEWHYG